MTPAPSPPSTTGRLPAPSTDDRAEDAEPVRALLVLGTAGPDPTALTSALEREGDLLVVGATVDPDHGIELAHLLQPDVVVIDQLLALADGTVVARQVLGDVHHAEIVLRTPWPDADRHEAERTGVFATVDVEDPAATVAAAIEAAGQRSRRTRRDGRRPGDGGAPER
jgi:DNA-binding NarL/FixJ family response regulator